MSWWQRIREAVRGGRGSGGRRGGGGENEPPAPIPAPPRARPPPAREPIHRAASRFEAADIVRNAAMEQMIRDHPADFSHVAVYADWLSDHGDPRGAILAAGLAAERADGGDRAPRLDRVRRLVAEANLALPVARYPDPSQHRFGLLRELRLVEEDLPAAALFDHPLLFALERVVTAVDPAALRAIAPARVRVCGHDSLDRLDEAFAPQVAARVVGQGRVVRVQVSVAGIPGPLRVAVRAQVQIPTAVGDAIVWAGGEDPRPPRGGGEARVFLSAATSLFAPPTGPGIATVRIAAVGAPGRARTWFVGGTIHSDGPSPLSPATPRTDGPFAARPSAIARAIARIDPPPRRPPLVADEPRGGELFGDDDVEQSALGRNARSWRAAQVRYLTTLAPDSVAVVGVVGAGEGRTGGSSSPRPPIPATCGGTRRALRWRTTVGSSWGPGRGSTSSTPRPQTPSPSSAIAPTPTCSPSRATWCGREGSPTGSRRADLAAVFPGRLYPPLLSPSLTNRGCRPFFWRDGQRGRSQGR